VTRKVLIVDDSKLARMAVIKVLKTLHPDWTGLEAANAEQALELMRAASPEFMLVDFNMPGKDGLSLAVEVHQTHPRISVAVISANRQAEVIQRTHAAGATFLAKPLTEQALNDFLNTAVERQHGAEE
jgi:YesN/AraC family two-component response regulator